MTITTITARIYHTDDLAREYGRPLADTVDMATLTLVHEVDVSFDPSTPTVRLALLEELYRRYNIGESDDAEAYRGFEPPVRDAEGRVTERGAPIPGKAVLGHDGRLYGRRSLSMGDVIVLGESAFVVASAGFRPVRLVDRSIEGVEITVFAEGAS